MDRLTKLILSIFCVIGLFVLSVYVSQFLPVIGFPDPSVSPVPSFRPLPVSGESGPSTRGLQPAATSARKILATHPVATRTPAPTPRPTSVAYFSRTLADALRVTARPTARPTKAPREYNYILNTNTGKFHYPNCSSVKQMNESNKKYYSGPRNEVIRMGYSPCGRCHP